jgi:hypothetical protein
MDIVDEQLDTIGKAFLGMTLGCARCHDHKFDPIPTRDYYALAGILKSTRSVVHANVSKWNEIELPASPEEEAIIQRQETELAVLEHQVASLQSALRKADGDPTVVDNVKSKQIKAAQRRIQQLKSEISKRPSAMAVADQNAVGDIPLAIRGVVHNAGNIVPRGVLQVATVGEAPRIPDDQSGRLELAQWIASPENPLTARVFVNRVWYWLFGAGIVRTVDNFGETGARPVHPELLDFLALQFVNDGWSIKRLIRRIMQSRVYQLSSIANERGMVIDPDNRLLWRMNRQRLDAESIRDTLLLLGGNLDETIGGPNIANGTKSEYGYAFASKRRSVYVPVFRNTLPSMFTAFDFADPNIQAGSRTVSTTAPQALLLMNHPLVLEQSLSAGDRLLQCSDIPSQERINHVFRQVLGRPPSDEEARLAREFVDNSETSQRWGLLYQTLVESLDFRYLK